MENRNCIFHKQVKTNEKPLLSFFAISDTHCTSDIMSQDSMKLKVAINDLNEINPNANALCIAGDMTNFGAQEEYETFMQILNSVNHPTPYFVIGNHDVRWQKGGYKEAYDRFINNTKMPSGYYDKWIEGYHFIFMSTDDDLKDEAYISDAQLDWLNEKMSENATEDKPIFVFLHQSLKSTSAGSYPEHGYSTSGYPDGVVQGDKLRKVLKKYPQCLFITGHTHAVIEHPKTVNNVDNIICVNTSSVSYTIAMDGYGKDNDSQGLCIDVYENRVIIRGRDFTRRQWIKNGEWEIIFPIHK